MAAYQKETKKRYGAACGYDTGPSPMPYIKKFLQPHVIPGQTKLNWLVYRHTEALLGLAESVST